MDVRWGTELSSSKLPGEGAEYHSPLERVCDKGHRANVVMLCSLPQRLPWQTGVDQRPDAAALRRLAEMQPAVVALCGPGWWGSALSVVGHVASSRAFLDAETLLETFDAASDAPRVFAIGYETGRAFIDLPSVAPPPGQPLAVEAVLDAILVVDERHGRWAVFGDPDPADELARLACSQPRCSNALQLNQRLSPVDHDDRIEHDRRVRRAQSFITAGDIYQGNVCRRVTVSAAVDGVEAYLALSRDNPVPHGGYFRAAGVELVSNSMETLLSYASDSELLTSRPIKGTCTRGAEGADHARSSLRRDVKECAEHVMIVDLIRNDLGRLCQPGSVRVSPLMDVEGYHGVWHGVSTVHGTRKAVIQRSDMLRALFPGGSITGAPKRRAVELLSTIEGEPRGFYTGSLALLSPDGALSMSILIRTLVGTAAGWSLGVGGGIVADSVAEREYAETQAKIAVFHDVLSRETNARGKRDLSYANQLAGLNIINLDSAPQSADSRSNASGSTIS